MPPMTMTRLWPTEAMPTNEASTRMARTLRSLAKPSIMIAPARNSSTPRVMGRAIEVRSRVSAAVVSGLIVACSRQR